MPYFPETTSFSKLIFTIEGDLVYADDGELLLLG